jgi:hypothetical protein
MPTKMAACSPLRIIAGPTALPDQLFSTNEGSGSVIYPAFSLVDMKNEPCSYEIQKILYKVDLD